MKQNFIIVQNMLTGAEPMIGGLYKAIPVDDFTEESIKKSIQQNLKIDTENIKRLTTGNPSVLGITEQTPSLIGKLSSVNIFYSENPAQHSHYLLILFAST